MNKNKLLLGLFILFLVSMSVALEKPFNIRRSTSNMTLNIDSQYSTWEAGWQSDFAIINGLSDFGDNSHVTVFQIGNTLHLIGGEQSVLYGYSWSGSQWQLNSSLLSGLSTETFAAPKFFRINNMSYILIGKQDGTFSGYHKSGSSWVINNTISSGLGDLGDYSTSTVFSKNNTYYLIAGKESGGFSGFKWNGSGWEENHTINSSLTMAGGYSTPTLFNKDGDYYLITGNSGGSFEAKKLQNNAWTDYGLLESGLSDIGAYPSPNIFHHKGIWYMIVGEEAGVLNGFRLYETINSSEGVEIQGLETNVGDADCNYTLYLDGTNITNPARVSFGYHNYTYLSSGCENFTQEMRTVFVNATSSIENLSSVLISNQSAVFNWDTTLSGNSSAEYGTTLNLVNTTVNTTEVLRGHQIRFNNLQAGSVYYYNVSSCYSSGYCAESGPYNFTTMDNCRKLYSSYTLQNNVSYGGGGSCFEIMNSSVTLNCSNYQVRGTIIGTGVLMQNQDNISLVDCSFRNFSKGIYSLNTTKLTIINSSSADNLGYDYYFGQSDVILEKSQSMFGNNLNISIISSTLNSSSVLNFSNEFILNINDSKTNTSFEIGGTTSAEISNSILQNITLSNSSNSQIQNTIIDMLTINNGTVQLINTNILITNLNLMRKSANISTITPGFNNIGLNQGFSIDFANSSTNILQLNSASSNLKIENSNFTILSADDSNLTVINSTIQELSLTNSVANFTELSNVSQQLNTSGTCVLDGIFQINNASVSGEVTRHYPIYIINTSGLPEINKNISIMDNQTLMWNGSTSSGYAVFNISFNSSTFNKSYNVSIPDISINKTIGGVELLTTTPLNMSTDILPPNITDWQPQGTLYDTSTSLRLTTNEWASCRYFTTNTTHYYNMNGTFDQPGLSHTSFISGLTNGDKTYYIRCKDRSNRISEEFAHNFTVSVWFRSEGGGGGGGSISSYTENPKQTNKWIDLKSGVENEMSIDNEKIAFTNLTFTTNKNISSIELTVEALDSIETIVKNSTLYKILQISEKDIEAEDYHSVSLEFKVPRSWIVANSSSPSDIHLYKYNNAWNRLDTNLIGQKSEYYYYRAIDSSFSKYAIVSVESARQVQENEQEEQKEQEVEIIKEQEQEQQEPQEPIPKKDKKQMSKFLVIALFLLIISLIVGGIIAYKKYDHHNSMKNIEKYISHQKSKTFTKKYHHKELEEFILRCKARGIDRKFVKEALVNAGWKEKTVDYYIVKYL